MTNKEGWIIFITDIKLRQRQRIQVMIETVVSLGLPAGERLLVKKNVLKPMVITGSEKRVCIVTGTHGDELEGQFVCYELNRRIEEHLEYLKGIVEIYPALNPLGVNSITRGVPGFDLDMNRVFPGSEESSLPEYAAYKIMEDLKGASLCIDIHASNIFLREIPQVRVSAEMAEKLLPYAKKLNTDFIWISSDRNFPSSFWCSVVFYLESMYSAVVISEMRSCLQLHLQLQRFQRHLVLS